MAVVAAVALVALAPVTTVGVVLTCAAIGAVAAGVTSVASSVIKGEEIDPKKVIIDMSFGAASGAFAATPIGVKGQIVFNGLSSGFQSWLKGGDIVDMIDSIIWGGVVGSLGGNGYGYEKLKDISGGYGFHMFNPFYIKDAVKILVKGVYKGIDYNITRALFEIAIKVQTEINIDAMEKKTEKTQF